LSFKTPRPASPLKFVHLLNSEEQVKTENKMENTKELTIAEAATQALEALTQCLSSDSANTIVVYDKFQKPFEGRHLQQEINTFVTEGRGFGEACYQRI
jgi:hypothetical protein